MREKQTDVAPILITSSTRAEGVSLLMLACRKRPHTVEALLGLPDIQPLLRDHCGLNPAHHSITHPHEQTGQHILHILFSHYPALKMMGAYSKGNYATLAISNCRPALLRLLAEEAIDIGASSPNHEHPFHQVVIQHAKYANREATYDMLRTLILNGCKEDVVNTQGQTFITFSAQSRILPEADLQEMVNEIRSEKLNKTYTVETSLQERKSSLAQDEDEDGSLSSCGCQEDQTELEVDHEMLSKEMWGWAQQVKQAHQSTWQALYPFYSRLQQLATEFYGYLEIIGSFASQLWIPSCDIDLLMVFPDAREDMLQQITYLIYNRIKNTETYRSIRMISNYKLPLIKLILNGSLNGLQVEVFLSNKKNLAHKYVTCARETISYFPQILPIFLVLRRFLQLHHLHDHKRGGLKAFALFLLTYGIRCHYQYPHISQFVQHFAYYYGWEYEFSGEHVKGKTEFRINIVDPLNPDNNLGGKHTDIEAIVELLRKIYIGIQTPANGSRLQYLVDLLQIS